MVDAAQLAAMLAPSVNFDGTARCRACPLPLSVTLVDRADEKTGLHVGCDEPAPIPTALAAAVQQELAAAPIVSPVVAAIDNAIAAGSSATRSPGEREQPAAPALTFTAPAGPPAAHPLKAELIGIVQWAAANAPRSLQTAVGPSELGVDCMRRLAYRIGGTTQVNTTADPWFSIVGTAVHDWLAVALDNYNAKVLNRIHYVVEKRVTVTSDQYGTSGSCDLYRDGTVIDHKIVGASAMKKYINNGPSNQYRKQVHIYGRGHEQAGRPVHEVAIAFYPRSGYLTDMHVWSEPYDRQIAEDTLSRAGSIQQLAAVLPPGLIPAAPDPAACTWCPFYRPGGPADTTGCPGPTSTGGSK